MYNRKELSALSKIITTELRKLYRGHIAEAKLKAKRHNRRWRYKPFLPSVLMGNANSLVTSWRRLFRTNGCAGRAV